MQVSQVYALTSAALPHDEAVLLMETLECAFHPEAAAVSMDEVDEAAGRWAVQAYYEFEFELADLQPVLAAAFEDPAAILASLTLAPVADENWVAVSLAGLAPVWAGRFFVHGSHDRDKRPVNGFSLELEAAVAFGTGHHETTMGCLLALDELLKRCTPRSILDVGCGTGVLGIAAARATHSPVIMSDIDPQAVGTARANARANRVAALVRTLEATGTDHLEIRAAEPYDLVFANILARPLVHLAPSLVRLCAPRADLVLSGLYVEQERWVTAAYRNAGAVMHKRIRLGQWSTLWLKAR